MTTFAIIPGAGSSGTAWSLVQRPLAARVLPVPDDPDVVSMGRTVTAGLDDVADPLVIAGASLGAMVALEVARHRPVAGLVLMAAGFGVKVGPKVLSMVDENPPELIERMARRGLVQPTADRVEARLLDFGSRGPGVLRRHLHALARYRPTELDDPPATVVLWGEHDRSVPFEDHLELASRCRGALRPLPGSGHCPYLEDPAETIRWMRFVASLKENSDGGNSGR
jgi:pimeloyl-ACP methyl ester carboxylesterase